VSIIPKAILELTHDSFLSNIPRQTHPLRPKPGFSSGDEVEGLNCLSWRLAVETSNVIEWKTVPKECEGYVGNYILGDQYRKDSRMVTLEAIKFAKSLNLSGDGKDVWVFDVDETTLSNIPYYAKHGFGAEPYNSSAFNEWVLKAEAPALPETFELYKELVDLGVKIVFLTGRSDVLGRGPATVSNLKNAGYNIWEKVILKNRTIYPHPTSIFFKSSERAKLVEEGYRIVGNMGDQWSDLLGDPTGGRTFKLPDPILMSIIPNAIQELTHDSFLSNIDIPRQMHLLRPKTGFSSGDEVEGLHCLSWRLAVETNNIIKWETVPKECEGYVGNYMLGQQYRNDSRIVTREAIKYVKSLTLSGDGKDAWVFDIDETTLSNLPYYAEHGFGAEPFNKYKFLDWVLKAEAKALPETFELYEVLKDLGVKIVFLTGRTDEFDRRPATEKNLRGAGYDTWEKTSMMILVAGIKLFIHLELVQFSSNQVKGPNS
ncbi:hypothetical protein Tsubulata_050935, partial [Turnera subulata]